MGPRTELVTVAKNLFLYLNVLLKQSLLEDYPFGTFETW